MEGPPPLRAPFYFVFRSFRQRFVPRNSESSPFPPCVNRPLLDSTVPCSPFIRDVCSIGDSPRRTFFDDRWAACRINLDCSPWNTIFFRGVHFYAGIKRLGLFHDLGICPIVATVIPRCTPFCPGAPVELCNSLLRFCLVCVAVCVLLRPMIPGDDRMTVYFIGTKLRFVRCTVTFR